MAQSKNSIITAMGHMHPHTQIPNSFFDTLDNGCQASWFESRTGIKTRHSVLKPEIIKLLRSRDTSFNDQDQLEEVATIASMSVQPWSMIKTRLGQELKPPEVLICGTSVPDYKIPANASSIANKLDLNSTCIDVNSACSSFVSNLMVAKSFITSSSADCIAIFNCERYTTTLDYNDKKSCMLFGDGAVATYIKTYSRGDTGLKILDTSLSSDPSGHNLVSIPQHGFFSQEGAKVQRFAITKTYQAAVDMMDRQHLSPQDVSYFIGHQANLKMLKASAEKIGFKAEQHLYNIDKFGNQGAAGAPIVLSQNWSRFKKGDLILVAVVGAGLTWGAALLQKY